MSPASDRRQGTVAHFLILAGRLAGILPRQTSLASAQADLLPWVLFQAARLGAFRLPGGGVLVGGRGETPTLVSPEAPDTSKPALRQQNSSLPPAVGKETFVGVGTLDAENVRSSVLTGGDLRKALPVA